MAPRETGGNNRHNNDQVISVNVYFLSPHLLSFLSLSFVSIFSISFSLPCSSLPLHATPLLHSLPHRPRIKNSLCTIIPSTSKHCLICQLLEIDLTVTRSGGPTLAHEMVSWHLIPVLVWEWQNGEPGVHSRSLNQWIVSQLLPTLDQVALRLLSIPAQSLLTCILHFLASDLTYLGTSNNLSLMRRTSVGKNI